MRKKQSPDFVILISTLLLLSIGIVMVYSSSAAISLRQGDPFYYTKRQLGFTAVGIIVMFIALHVDYNKWKRWAKPAILLSFSLLILVLVIGKSVNGAKSWLGVGSFGIQPAEFAKLGLIFYLANWLTAKPGQIRSFSKGVLPTLGIGCGLFLLTVVEPALGMGVVIILVCILMIFIAGCRFFHLAALSGLGLTALSLLVWLSPYRLKRITAFMDPWQDPLGSGYQIIQSLYAIAPGGFTGLGLGMSRQKFFYLPEPNNDFIYSILCEELGFIGASLVLMLFLLLIWRGMRIAILCRNPYGTYLSAGITGMLAFQVVINVGVAEDALPITGITLPFISYGGSSLLLMLFSIGILLNISREETGVPLHDISQLRPPSGPPSKPVS